MTSTTWKCNIGIGRNRKGAVSHRDARQPLYYGISCQALCFGSSETESFFLPFALLLASTFCPSAVDILFLKPCLFFLFRVEG